MNTTERIGVSKVQLIVYEKLNWIFREQPIDDYGIDAHIELKDDNYATGKLIAVQIKSGESYFKNESNNEIIYYIDEKHLKYWKSNILPVIIILYNPKTEECIWEYIGKIKEKNKIHICKSHRFNENAKDELLKIANIEPYKIAQSHRRNYIEKNKSLEVIQEYTQFEGKKQQRENKIYQIAIDFGTTKTMVGIISVEEIIIIKTLEGKNFFETAVAFDKNYQYYIGVDAINRKDIQGYVLIRNFKRELGLNKEYQVFGLTFSAEDITTLYFQAIIDYIKVEYGIDVGKCCISVPIDFSYYQKKAYIQCIKNCNISIVRTIQESTCVSIDEKLSLRETMIIIIDIGGGTFDVSLIETGEGLLEVYDVTGDRTVGGVDYDLALTDYMKKMLKKKYQGIIIDAHLENQILFKSEEVKILLSTMEKVSVVFTECYCEKYDDIMMCCIEISRNDFREITNSLNVKIAKILYEFKEQIDLNDYPQPEVVMLGGLGSKIFTINEIIKKCFSIIKIIDSYSEKRTAEGLAIYSRKLQRYCKHDLLLLDVFGYDIILKGELLYASTPEYSINNNTINKIPTFAENEKVSELKIITKSTTIPTRKYAYFGITYNQRVSIFVSSMNQKDKVFTYDIVCIYRRTIYEIEIDIDAYGCLKIIMKDVLSQKVVCEYILEY